MIMKDMKGCRIETLSARRGWKTECKEVEEFVGEIRDSTTRRIFQMYFIDGEVKPSQTKVAKRLHLDRSRISRRIDDYLKNAQKCTESTCIITIEPMGSLLYLSYILFVIRLPGVMARWSESGQAAPCGRATKDRPTP